MLFVIGIQETAEVQENGDGQMVEAKVPYEDLRFIVCEFCGSGVQPVTATGAPFLASVHPLNSNVCPSEAPSFWISPL